MRILVTGAEGFVGAHLVRELDAGGHLVFRTDKGDAALDEEGAAEGLVRQREPDYVVHLAARYGRLLCRDEPHLAVQDNAAATTELADACAERGIPVLYASSSEVYGDHGEDRIHEESELRMPTTIYGLSKRWGEEALNLYMPPEKLCIVRMNMLYGPEQLGGYGRCALATWIQDAVEGRPLIVHRGTSRSWLYIADATRALRMLIEGAYTGVWNLGNQHEVEPVEETAQRVSQMRQLIDPPAGQIRHKNYDSSKIEGALGWKPQVLLEEGIAQTFEWAREEATIAA